MGETSIRWLWLKATGQVFAKGWDKHRNKHSVKQKYGKTSTVSKCRGYAMDKPNVAWRLSKLTIDG